MRPTIRLSTLSAVGLLLAAACGPGGPSGAGDDAAASGGDEAAAPAGAAARQGASLLAIMVDLDAEMDRIAHGIWLEDRDTVAAGAGAIAGHPKIPPEERAQVQRILGDDFPAFGRADRRVHDASVELEAMAGEAGFGEIMDAYQGLQDGCLSCHDAFRGRIRNAREGS